MLLTNCALVGGCGLSAYVHRLARRGAKLGALALIMEQWRRIRKPIELDRPSLLFRSDVVLLDRQVWIRGHWALR